MAIDDLSPIAYPNPTDIFWFHHLLELCSAFSPEHQPNQAVFDFLVGCTTLLAEVKNSSPHLYLFKHLCIGVLLWLLGFYPPECYLKQLLIMRSMCEHGLYNTPNSCASLIGGQDTKELDLWILECVQSHPHAQTFKTSDLLHFYQPQISEDDHENK
jgi:hypothetical protein